MCFVLLEKVAFYIRSQMVVMVRLVMRNKAFRNQILSCQQVLYYKVDFPQTNIPWAIYSLIYLWVFHNNIFLKIILFRTFCFKGNKYFEILLNTDLLNLIEQPILSINAGKGLPSSATVVYHRHQCRKRTVFICHRCL